jgi:transcriptional regulator with XRE-family HTH domain
MAKSVNNLVSDFGTELRLKRWNHKITQAKLSAMFRTAGKPVSNVLISQWERGRKTPSDDHIHLLVQFLGAFEHQPKRKAKGRPLTLTDGEKSLVKAYRAMSTKDKEQLLALVMSS